MQLFIPNEYDKLETVLVHRPGEEIDRLTHENMKRYLFEDIPYLTGMQEEHDEFIGDMVDHDIKVLYLEVLLLELFNQQPLSKTELIRQICTSEQAPAIASDLSDEKIFSNADLIKVLFAGITNAEYYERTGRPDLVGSARSAFILPPIPNAYFSRDPAVAINRCVVACKMHYTERVRETLLIRALLEDHPQFAGHIIAYGGSRNPDEDRPFTIEGGDVIVINEEAVLVGVSERTRSETIKILARKLFAGGYASRIYQVPIPTERTFMHLDTVFTIVDRGVVVWYPGVMEQIKHITKVSTDGHGGVLHQVEPRSLNQILSDEFGRELKVIRTGGGDEHYATREQRTDGTNILAIAPGVACTYRRNARTITAMEKAGIKVLSIPGSELVRGLGGPRCMTMPLRRVTG